MEAEVREGLSNPGTPAKLAASTATMGLARDTAADGALRTSLHVTAFSPAMGNTEKHIARSFFAARVR
eukprot:CAMPEP_0194270974 /NCGR_PEP_ID=MMETSP0169-20130528/4870_1 /TAXON_ID=218684 /ORGANISM="Corethron pennatum, Strain L29A3" /LENGTH=67 /DNA_ID=CAMNT_0039013211 /DNA_START=197 /DNA_END=396 /DNA_ORIENTATION=+